MPTPRTALFALVDDEITSVAWEEQMAMERAEVDAAVAAELGDLAEVDALVDAAEREWTTADLDETWRLSRGMTDQPRARRTRRRADRSAMRLLAENALIGGVTSQGKTAAVRQLLLSDDAEGSVA